jgi:2-oxoisovalerate dehydrogenase E1 component
MFNRAEIIDRNFTKLTKNSKFPQPRTIANLSDLNIQTHDLISIFQSQVLSRHMDLKARTLKDETEILKLNHEFEYLNQRD